MKIRLSTFLRSYKRRKFVQFDCLKMKDVIHAKIYAEIKDMTTEYFHISFEQDLFRKKTQFAFVIEKKAHLQIAKNKHFTSIFIKYWFGYFFVQLS